MEENKSAEVTETEVNQDTAGQEEPTVTVAEMKRRISKEQENAQKKIDEMNARIEERIAEEVAKAQEVAKLNGKELEEYKQKEQKKKYEDEIAKRDAELEQLRQENLQRAIRDEAITKLAELNIPSTPETVELVSGDSLDEMAERAELLAKYTSTIKNKYATSEPPRTSGGMRTAANVTPSDIFREANILNKQRER